MQNSLDMASQKSNQKIRVIRVIPSMKRVIFFFLLSAFWLHRQTINAIELGKYAPSAVLAMKIARVFGKSVEEVFELEDTD